MGLFSKKPAETVVHPDVERVVYVRSTGEPVSRHLDEYSTLFPAKRSAEHRLLVSNGGDWTAIRLPDAVHPWQLHNLAYWMLDCGDGGADVIARSAASSDLPAYRLVRDPEVPDALCGWDDDGQGLTVHVPGNDIVRGEDVPVPRVITMPSGFSEWREITVLLEDPGADMNPTNQSTKKSRAQLVQHFDSTWMP